MVDLEAVKERWQDWPARDGGDDVIALVSELETLRQENEILRSTVEQPEVQALLEQTLRRWGGR